MNVFSSNDTLNGISLLFFGVEEDRKVAFAFLSSHLSKKVTHEGDVASAEWRQAVEAMKRTTLSDTQWNNYKLGITSLADLVVKMASELYDIAIPFSAMKILFIPIIAPCRKEMKKEKKEEKMDELTGI